MRISGNDLSLDQIAAVIALASWCFAVALAGGLVGLVLGNIRLPAVLLASSSPASAGGANIAISAIAAGTASIRHIRAGRVNWKLVLWMLPPSVVGALVGGYLSGLLPGQLLLAGIAAILIYSSIDLFRWNKRRQSSSAGAVKEADEVEREMNLTAAIITGLVVGLLGGFVGLILGTLRMPALIKYVGETAHRAVGTNVVIGFFVGVAGLIGHLPTAAPDFTVILIGGLASIPGAYLGSHLTGRLSEAQLIRAVAFLLLVAAAGCIVQAVT